jgi:hypothetical protein
LIQDLAPDLDRVEAALRTESVIDAARWRARADRLRSESPMIPDDSVDCVVSNCVLNLIRPQDRRPLFTEVFFTRTAIRPC